MKRSRLGLQLVFGLALSALLIWLSVRSLDPREIGRALAAANWVWFLPVCALTLLAFWIRAVRWGWLLRSVKPIGVASLYSATMIGFAANNLLPARLGEVVRPWALGASERISRSSAFATVIVERVIDMFCILLLLGIALVLHPFPPRVQEAGIVALLMNLGLLIALILIERKPEVAERLAQWLGGHLPGPIAPKAASFLRNFSSGLGVFRHGPGLAWVTFYSAVMFAGDRTRPPGLHGGVLVRRAVVRGARHAGRDRVRHHGRAHAGLPGRDPVRLRTRALAVRHRPRTRVFVLSLLPPDTVPADHRGRTDLPGPPGPVAGTGRGRKPGGGGHDGLIANEADRCTATRSGRGRLGARPRGRRVTAAVRDRKRVGIPEFAFGTRATRRGRRPSNGGSARPAANPPRRWPRNAASISRGGCGGGPS
jgi:uncharacterized membrane protein YbhN (UPF0104 family)